MSPRRARALDGRVGDDPATALREHLIDAVERLLAEAPISAITTRDIAHAAEVSDGVLYNYFKDKNELILAALLRRYAGLAARFEADLPKAGGGTVEGNLNSLAQALLALLAEALPTVAGLLTEPVMLHRLFDEIHRQPFSPQYLQARVADYLRDEQRMGRLSADVDASSVATLIMGATIVLNLGNHLARLQGRLAQPVQVRPIIATLIRGLAPANGSR